MLFVFWADSMRTRISMVGYLHDTHPEVVLIDTTHCPGLCPEDEAPAGQLTKGVWMSMLESTQADG